MKPSKSPQDYRQRAAACERQAELATQESTREMMLYLALRWHALADEAEGKKPLQPRAPSPPPFE